jgi:mycoredoxin
MESTQFSTAVKGREKAGFANYRGVMSAQITMYWRPGCGFCSALQRNLDRLEVSYDKVNIWDSPEGAEFVRSVARGNETVPTVTVGDISMVNPSAQDVLEAVLKANEATS